MKVVILCGGKGSRLREETEFRPKPMIPIGAHPILWHIMKTYAHHGHKEFILCLGYKGDFIKDYFRNYLWHTRDVTLSLGPKGGVQYHGESDEADWSVTLADTGENSMTAYRVKSIQHYIPPGESFLLTYGDGLATIDINASIRSHQAAGKICTISAVHPAGRFGSLRIDDDGSIHQFSEKPQFEAAYVNGGYMVCDHRIFGYLPEDPAMMLERKPMDDLVRDRELNSYRHEGFWQPMDTYQEAQFLNELWAGGHAVEGLVMFGGAYSGRKVWLSGHTGFKGSWLALWLLELGAEVTGFALAPEEPGLFHQLGLAGRLRHELGDVRDADAVARSIRAAAPDFVFHLAAQPLVRRSYEIPVETYAVNALGPVHVLEALRAAAKPCAAVFVTTDKCYENREWDRAYHEEDLLGGHDPYSSSKGMAELAISAYRRSYFSSTPVRVASARAGNVLGGGDWAADRIVPDCVRALRAGRPIAVRNAAATRPWQHVLEPLGGYLSLGRALAAAGDALHPPVASAFNFGPPPQDCRTVADLVREILRHWPGEWSDQSEPGAPHEAGRLSLATDKARRLLGWAPVWDFATTVDRTMAWYRQVAPEDSGSPLAATLTRAQIHEYSAQARSQGLPWSR